MSRTTSPILTQNTTEVAKLPTLAIRRWSLPSLARRRQPGDVATRNLVHPSCVTFPPQACRGRMDHCRRPARPALIPSGIIPLPAKSSLEGVRQHREGRLEPSELERFEAMVLPYLDAAYTLARYLTRNDHDAQDVVQDAYLRALKYFSGFRGAEGGDGRAWLLAIVRNTAYTWR